MQKIAPAGVIHLPNLTEFCNQSNGRAYLFETCESGQHYQQWFLYLTAFDQWGTPIVLTIHGGESFVGDTGTASLIKESLKAKRAKAEEMLREKELVLLGGFIGRHDAKMIGTL